MKHWRWVSLVVGTVGLVVLLIWFGYAFDWEWTGLGSAPKSDTIQPAKTAWDWLQLLFVPAVLAGAALWFNAQQAKVERERSSKQSGLEREIAQDQQRENALQAYLDRMADLLLGKELRDSKEEDEIRQVARARTLTVLRRLDAARKAALLQFLYEAQLIKSDHNIIPLGGADLNGVELDVAHIGGSDLSWAKLKGAHLGVSPLSFFRGVVC